MNRSTVHTAWVWDKLFNTRRISDPFILHTSGLLNPPGLHTRPGPRTSSVVVCCDSGTACKTVDSASSLSCDLAEACFVSKILFVVSYCIQNVQVFIPTYN